MDKSQPSTSAANTSTPHTFQVSGLGIKYQATFSGDNPKEAEKCARNALRALDIARQQPVKILPDVQVIRKISAEGLTFVVPEGEKAYYTYEELEELISEKTAEKIAKDLKLDGPMSKASGSSATNLKPDTFTNIAKVWRQKSVAGQEGTKLLREELTPVLAPNVITARYAITARWQKIAQITAQLIKASLSKNFVLVNELKNQLNDANEELNNYIEKINEVSIQKGLIKDGFLAKGQILAYKREFDDAFKGTLQNQNDLGKTLSEKLIINEIFDQLVEVENQLQNDQGKKFAISLCNFSGKQKTAMKESPKVLENCKSFASEVVEFIREGTIDQSSLLLKSEIEADPFLLGKDIRSKELIEKNFLEALGNACKALEDSGSEYDQQAVDYFEEVKQHQAAVVRLSIPGNPTESNQAANEATRKQSLAGVIQAYNESVEKLTKHLGRAESLNVIKYKDALLLGVQIHGKNEYLSALKGKSPEQQKFIQYQIDRFALQITNQLAFHGYKIQGYDVAEIREGLEKTTNKATNDFDQIVEKVGLAAIAEKMGALLEAIKDGVLAIRNFLYECIFPEVPSQEAHIFFQGKVEGLEKSMADSADKIITMQLSLDPAKIKRAAKLEQETIDRVVKEVKSANTKVDAATLTKLVQAELNLAKMEALVKLAETASPNEQERYLALHDELEEKVLLVKEEFSKLTGNTGKVGRNRQQSQMNEQSTQSTLLRVYFAQSKPTRAAAEKAFNGQLELLKKEAVLQKMNTIPVPPGQKNPGKYLDKKREDITQDVEKGKTAFLEDLNKSSDSLKAINSSHNADDIKGICEEFEKDYIQKAEIYWISITGGSLDANTRQIVVNSAKAHTVAILEDLMKENVDNDQFTENLLAVRDEYQTIRSTNLNLASFSGPKKIQNVVNMCVKHVLPDIEIFLTKPTSPKNVNQIRNEVSQNVKESLGELGITNTAFIEDVTMLVWCTAQVEAYNASKSQNQNLKNSMPMMAGMANQIQSSLTEARVREVTKPPLPKARAITELEKINEGKMLTNEEQELKAKNDAKAQHAKLEKEKRVADLVINDPFYPLQRQAMFGNIGDPAKFTQSVHDVKFRHGEFDSFDAFENQLLTAYSGTVPEFAKLVQDTKATTKKRAEKFTEYHKEVEAYKPGTVDANVRFNHLEKLQAELALLDEQENNLEIRWQQVVGIERPQGYFAVFREHSGMHIGSNKNDPLMQDMYVRKANSYFKTKTDFSNVRNKEVQLPAPNLAAAEANFNKVDDTIKMGISLSDRANSLSTLISTKPTEIKTKQNLAKDLNHVISGQLDPLGPRAVGKITVKQKIFDNIAKESKAYEVSVANFINGSAQPQQLRSDVAVGAQKFLNDTRSTKHLSQPEKNQIAKGIRVTVLLEQLSAAQAVMPKDALSTQRKAIIVNTLIDSLSTALNDLEYLIPGKDGSDTRLATMKANLNVHKIKVSTDGSGIDGIRQAFIKDQLNKALGEPEAITLNTLTAKAKEAQGEQDDRTKNDVIAELKKGEAIIGEILLLGMDPARFERLQTQLAIINDKVNDPRNGVLFGLHLMAELIASNQELVPFVTPLFTNVHNNLKNQFPAELRGDFDNVHIAMPLPKKAQNVSPALLPKEKTIGAMEEALAQEKIKFAAEQQLQAITGVIAQDPDMKLSQKNYKAVSRDLRAIEYEKKLQSFFASEAKNKNLEIQELIDNDKAPVGKTTGLIVVYDLRFEALRDAKKKNEAIPEAVSKVTEMNEAKVGVGGTSVDADPTPAIYYWLKKANACANTPEGILDKEICYKEITRLIEKLPKANQDYYKTWPGDNAPFFSEYK